MNWKKILTALAIAAMALLLVVVGGGMLLDPSVELETESTLDAAPEVLHALIADPAGVIRWWQGAGEEMGIEAMDEGVVHLEVTDEVDSILMHRLGGSRGNEGFEGATVAVRIKGNAARILQNDGALVVNGGHHALAEKANTGPV